MMGTPLVLGHLGCSPYVNPVLPKIIKMYAASGRSRGEGLGHSTFCMYIGLLAASSMFHYRTLVAFGYI